MKKIFQIYALVITALILQMQGNLIAQTVDEGVALIQQKKFSEAQSVFEKILDKDENSAEAHYQLGLIYLHRSNPQRDIDEAVNHLEIATDLNSSHADYFFRYGAALGEKAQHAGVIKQAFLAPKIKKAFLQAVDINPKLALARIGLAQFYLMAPSIVGGDEEEGWKQLDEAIKLDEVQGRSVKASMLARVKKNDEAEKEFKTLVHSKSGDWRTWKNYGRFCMNATRYEDAIKQFEKYVELRSDTADSFNSLGEGFLKEGDTDQAIHMFRKALELDKNFHSSMQNMGEAYQLKGQKKEAKEMYQAVLANHPPDFYRKAAEKKLKEIE
jgi:tetratricopeptide (TPR) repeat protein